MDEERTFKEPEELLEEALEGLERTDELTRRNRSFLRERVEEPRLLMAGFSGALIRALLFLR